MKGTTVHTKIETAEQLKTFLDQIASGKIAPSCASDRKDEIFANLLPEEFASNPDELLSPRKNDYSLHPIVTTIYDLYALLDYLHSHSLDHNHSHPEWVLGENVEKALRTSWNFNAQDRCTFQCHSLVGKNKLVICSDCGRRRLLCNIVSLPTSCCISIGVNEKRSTCNPWVDIERMCSTMKAVIYDIANKNTGHFEGLFGIKYPQHSRFEEQLNGREEALVKLLSKPIPTKDQAHDWSKCRLNDWLLKSY